MTTATTDIRQKIASLEAEKADYSGQKVQTLARLDVLRREARGSGPQAARSAQIRELEAVEVRLNGVLAQIEVDLQEAHAAQVAAEMALQDEADLARIRYALEVEGRAGQAKADLEVRLAELDPALLAVVRSEAEQRQTRVGAQNAVRAMAVRHGLIPEDALNTLEVDSVLERFARELGVPDVLLLSVVRSALPTLVWPVLPVEAE